MNNTHGWRYKLCSDNTWTLSWAGIGPYVDEECGFSVHGFESKDAAREYARQTSEKAGCPA